MATVKLLPISKNNRLIQFSSGYGSDRFNSINDNNQIRAGRNIFGLGWQRELEYLEGLRLGGSAELSTKRCYIDYEFKENTEYFVTAEVSVTSWNANLYEKSTNQVVAPCIFVVPNSDQLGNIMTTPLYQPTTTYVRYEMVKGPRLFENATFYREYWQSWPKIFLIQAASVDHVLYAKFPNGYGTMFIPGVATRRITYANKRGILLFSDYLLNTPRAEDAPRWIFFLPKDLSSNVLGFLRQGEKLPSPEEADVILKPLLN